MDDMIGRTFLELPEDQDTFEEFVRDLFEYEYNIKLDILGKGPKSQDGIDILGKIPDSNWTPEFAKLRLSLVTKGNIGIQAKSRAKSLSYSAIQSDHNKAKDSVLNIIAFVVATSARSSTTVIKNLEINKHQLTILKHVYYKQDLQALYLKYPDLWERYHPLGVQLSEQAKMLEFGANRFIELGKDLLKSGKYDAATFAADSAISIQPERIEHWIIKCNSYLASKLPEKVLTTVDEAVTVLGEVPVLIWLKAVALLQLGMNESIGEFKRAYELSVEPDESIMKGYIWALVAEKKLSVAELLVKACLEEEPNDEYWIKQLALIHFQKEEYATAVELFETKVEQIEGTGHQGWYGYALKEAGRLRDGYPHIEAALMRIISGSFPKPHKAALYVELGMLSTQMNELDGAREFFTNAEYLYSNLMSLWLGWAALFMRERNHDAAEGALFRAMEINPSNENVHARIARLRMSQSRITEAYDYYKQAIALTRDEEIKNRFRDTASLDFYFIAYRKQQEYIQARNPNNLNDVEYAATRSIEFVENSGASEILKFVNKERENSP